MNFLDHAILNFFRHEPQAHPRLDELVYFISGSDLLKGGVVLAMFWWAWCRRPGRTERALLLTGLGAAVLALFCARILAYALPFRTRPILEASLHFAAPAGMPSESGQWTSWSSFPSDHAALFFPIIYGVWRTWKTGGTWLFLYAILLIALPRVYTGIHYPTDILGGALLGILLVMLLALPIMRNRMAAPLADACERWPGFAHALLFLVTFQMATVFFDLRSILAFFGFST